METESILLLLSIALLSGLLMSRVAKLLQLPAVTAYLFAGILIGPYLLGSLGALLKVDGLGFTAIPSETGGKYRPLLPHLAYLKLPYLSGLET